MNVEPDHGATAPEAPRIIPRAEHPISRKNISPNALRVLYRLRDGGHQAYLVGGCLRDLVLGVKPKDFDVATSARPEEVKRLFRNSRLIGRRFRLAHVFFGQEIIEVATFRAASAPSQGEEPEDDPDILPEVGASDDGEEQVDDDPVREDPDRVLDEGGRILRDNTYGTLEEDVWRRDFSCNALYYDIGDFSLRDYVGAMDDIEARRLRLIGDAGQRYREDPVRMLRAVRFEAKLGFALDDDAASQLAQLRQLLADVPAARLFDETLKLFLTGHGERSFDALRRHGLFEVLYPDVERYLQRHPGGLVEQLLRAGLANTDARVAAGKPVTPTFLFTLLLYGPIAEAIEKNPARQWDEVATILAACDDVVHAAQRRVQIPRRFSLGLREMFALQPRLERPRGRRSLRLLEQSRFRAAYDLLLLRAQVGIALPEAAQWWTRLQDVGEEEREQMLAAVERATARPREGRGSRSRRRPRRSRAAGSE